MESEFRLERRNLETAVELDKLRGGFTSIVKAGTKSELARLIEQYPQRNARGSLIWLLTSGMAIELTTGYQRQHHDLDVVVMDPNNLWHWELLGTDNVTPGQYWADMKFDCRELESTALPVVFQHGSSRYRVEVVHPTIIMTQKMSDAFGRQPRQKDVDDAVSVAQWWEGPQKGNAPWINIVEGALSALPHEQIPTTKSRIFHVVKQLFPIKP